MKNIVFLLMLITLSFSISAQEQYTVNGKTYELKTEVEGDLVLLWNIIDKQYRYFVKTSDGTITELVNTKDINNNYQEEYKKVLKRVMQNTDAPTNDLKLTLNSLKDFFQAYNTSLGHSPYSNNLSKLKSRLGLFGGITNQPFVANPENTTVPFFGAEFEVVSALEANRHAGFFSISHALDNDDFKYSSTQLALGYRYRFIKKPDFNIYGNVKFATYTFSETSVELEGGSIEVVKNPDFQVPFAFGLGADIKVGDSGFITLAYNELFAVFVDNNGNFPLDFAIGYKFNL